MARLRRVVTGHSANGKSKVIFDGAPPNSDGGMAELWRTMDRTPNRGNAEAGGIHTEMEAPIGGTLFRYLEMPPGMGRATAEEFKGMLKAMNADHALGDQSRHPMMHRTNSIDYIVVLAGQITLLLDEGEVTVGPNEVIVQRGTSHAWENRGAEPVRLVAVNVNCEPL